MFQTKAVEKIKTHTLCKITFSPRLCHVRDNVEKCGRARQAADNNLTQHVHFACWITKAADTQNMQ